MSRFPKFYLPQSFNCPRMMSARSSSDFPPLAHDALLDDEKYQSLTQPSRRGLWTRLYRAAPSMKWVIVFSTQLLLLHQTWQLRRTPVRNGDDINRLAPRRMAYLSSRFQVGESTGQLTTYPVSTTITRPTNDMDVYISNYTSDEDMMLLRHRWQELLPCAPICSSPISWFFLKLTHD